MFNELLKNNDDMKYLMNQITEHLEAAKEEIDYLDYLIRKMYEEKNK